MHPHISSWPTCSHILQLHLYVLLDGNLQRPFSALGEADPTELIDGGRQSTRERGWDSHKWTPLLIPESHHFWMIDMEYFFRDVVEGVS